MSRSSISFGWPCSTASSGPPSILSSFSLAASLPGHHVRWRGMGIVPTYSVHRLLVRHPGHYYRYLILSVLYAFSPKRLRQCGPRRPAVPLCSSHSSSIPLLPGNPPPCQQTQTRLVSGAGGVEPQDLTLIPAACCACPLNGPDNAAPHCAGYCGWLARSVVGLLLQVPSLGLVPAESSLHDLRASFHTRSVLALRLSPITVRFPTACLPESDLTCLSLSHLLVWSLNPAGYPSLCQ